MSYKEAWLIMYASKRRHEKKHDGEDVCAVEPVVVIASLREETGSDSLPLNSQNLQQHTRDEVCRPVPR